jgi:hypothetical protein
VRETRNAYKIVIGKLEGKGQLERPMGRRYWNGFYRNRVLELAWAHPWLRIWSRHRFMWTW